MDRRELAMVVLGTTDKEDQRVQALLDLIDMSVSSKYSKQVEGHLSFHEDCIYNHDGDCWLNIPDSVEACYPECLMYKSKQFP